VTRIAIGDVLARVMRRPDVDVLLSSPEGKAIAALVEAAVEWRTVGQAPDAYPLHPYTDAVHRLMVAVDIYLAL
jgi:hypothetical protein